MEITSRTEAVDGRFHIKSKPTLYLRFLKWVYQEYPRDTCLLFWGTAALPIAFPFFGVLWIITMIAAGLDHLFPRRESTETKKDYWARMDAEMEAQAARNAKRRTRQQRLQGFSDKMGAIWFKVCNVLGPVIAFVLPILGVILALAAVALIIFAIVQWTGTVLQILLVVGTSVVFATLAVGIAFLIANAWERYRKTHPKTDRPGLLKTALHNVHNHTCAKIDVE